MNRSLFGNKFDAERGDATSSTVRSDSITVSDGVTVIHTSGLSGTISGYAGSVPLDIYIRDGRISEIETLPNAETPSFFQRASGILKEWEGKSPEEASGINVDAVSGATYSSQALINNVKVGLAAYEGGKSENNRSVPVKIWIALVVTLAACVLPLFVKSRIYHSVQMIANVVVLGFWTGQFLDYAMILKYTSDGFTFPAILVAMPMLIAAFIYPLFGYPQHYCTHICPLGSAQQLMGRICGFKIKISVKTLHGLEWFRKILWAALMLLLWGDCLTCWMDLELFQAFQYKSASIGITVAACAFLALSAVVSRPYCRFVCPTGSLFKRAENLG
ncbi:MAG: FMN-binding protein [Muribaculaceae bacterium]|nr:FMN-binding protein [Muribaculaceae bacterium]